MENQLSYLPIAAVSPATSPDHKTFLREETPLVKFNGEQGVLLIKGHSIQENSVAFYMPVLTLVEEYLKEQDKLTLYLFFKAFDAQTAKILFRLFENLRKQLDEGKNIKVNWFADCSNPEMIETGIDFEDLYNLKMNILPI